MSILTRRWNDPAGPEDGFRLLICRYWPRGVSKARATWDAWNQDLGPSRQLHAEFYGKHGLRKLTFQEYRRRYLAEMKAQREAIRALAERVRAGERITLLCSSACTDPGKCHRTLLAGLIETAMAEL